MATGSSGGGTPFLGLPVGWKNVLGGTNINAAAANNVPPLDVLNTAGPGGYFSNFGPNEISCDQQGMITVEALMCVVGPSATRWNGRLIVTQNGIPQFAVGSSGYIRNASGHNESSLHVNGLPLLVSPGDLIGLRVDREATSINQVNTKSGVLTITYKVLS